MRMQALLEEGNISDRCGVMGAKRKVFAGFGVEGDQWRIFRNLHESGKHGDAAFYDRHHERRGGCTCRLLRCERQAFGVVGHEGSDQKDGNDVEDEDPPEGEFDGLGNDPAWILCFSNGDTLWCISLEGRLRWH